MNTYAIRNWFVVLLIVFSPVAEANENCCGIHGHDFSDDADVYT